MLLPRFSKIPYRQIHKSLHRYNSSSPASSTIILPTFEPIHPTLLKRAELLSQEHKELENVLSQGGNFNLNDQKKFSQLASVVDIYREYIDAVDSFKELESLLLDDSLKDEAEAELESTLPHLLSLTGKLQAKLLPAHEFADRPAMLELRPGVGGVEAMIFTQDLLNMYLGYAAAKRWPTSIISKTGNTQGNGITEAIISVDEPGSYDRLRFEAGVHRVQRIPETETKGRTQTSTAAVVVLPKMSERGQSEDADERSFAQGEVRIDVMRASGKGGQHVNTTESAVRLTHLPSGIVVAIQDERSQHKNKAKAFGILRARLAEMERVEKEKEERQKRTDQVTTTDRADKIRTYNVPQNRVTDHRCSLSVHDVEGVLNGGRLDEIVDSLITNESHEKSRELLAQIEKEHSK